MLKLQAGDVLTFAPAIAAPPAPAEVAAVPSAPTEASTPVAPAPTPAPSPMLHQP